MKRFIVFLLAAQMLLSAAACSKNESSETTPDTAAPVKETEAYVTEGAETEPAEPAETKFDRTTVSDNLPDITFNGRDFRFIANDDAMFQLVAEDYTGIETNDVIFDRNKRVEDRFDVKITAFTTGGESQDALHQFCAVDEHIAEVADVWSRMGLSLAGDSRCLDWMQIPYIDWDKPWWNKDANADGIINGRMFNVTGEMAITAMQYTWALAYNMELLEDNGYPTEVIYDLVLDGNWTLDKMIEICSGIYTDKNGNSLRDPDDVYGFASFVSIGSGVPGVYGARSMPWVQAAGERFYTFNEDRTSAQITLGTEKVYSLLEKLLYLHYNTEGGIAYANRENSDANDAHALNGFMNGLVGIYPTTFQSCFTSFTDLGFDYGMLPYPKYDTAQEKYYTVPFEAYSIYQLPCTLPLEDFGMVGVIMEALNAESWKTVSVTYYDKAMKGRYSTDETTAEIIDLIMESRLFEWGYQVAIFAPGYAKTPFVFSCMIADNNVDLASTLAEHWDNSMTALDLCIYFYDDEYVNPLLLENEGK